jgi:GntR family transcriptional regulator
MSKPSRGIRYHDIAANVRDRIQSGAIAQGGILPSESALSAEFGVSRVTIRRALEILREEGTVNARQGLGWFATGATMSQSLGVLGTIEEQMTANGMVSERHVVEYAFEKATNAIAKTLDSDQVLRVKRINTANGEPFAVVTVWCPAELGKRLSRLDVERSPFYELLDVALKNATQVIGADAASPEEARLLEVPVGSPVLRCERVTRDAEGKAVLLSHHVFPAHKTNFVVELSSATKSIAPTGLRLIDALPG